MRGEGSGQRINKEYSTRVRATNELQERKKDLCIQHMEKHKRLFLNRHAYEKKMILKFRNELNTKSQKFDETKFGDLRRRVQTARGRLQPPTSGNNNGDIGPITELLPRQYYRKDSAKSATVKFYFECSESSSESDVESDTFSDSDSEVSKGRRNSTFQQLSNWSRMSQSASSAAIRRRRESYAEFVKGTESVDICIPAPSVRRSSAPSRIMSAYVPRDLPETSSRRSSQVTTTSKSSSGSSTSLNDVTNRLEDPTTASRSFRLLKEACIKRRQETANPREEILRSAKQLHYNQTHDLLEKTAEKFKMLISHSCFVSKVCH